MNKASLFFVRRIYAKERSRYPFHSRHENTGSVEPNFSFRLFPLAFSLTSSGVSFLGFGLVCLWCVIAVVW